MARIRLEAIEFHVDLDEALAVWCFDAEGDRYPDEDVIALAAHFESVTERLITVLGGRAPDAQIGWSRGTLHRDEPFRPLREYIRRARRLLLPQEADVRWRFLVGKVALRGWDGPDVRHDRLDLRVVMAREWTARHESAPLDQSDESARWLAELRPELEPILAEIARIELGVEEVLAVRLEPPRWAGECEEDEAWVCRGLIVAAARTS